MQTAEVIHSDAANLESIGLNGYVSCQVQRIFLPSGFAMHILGKTLWDKNTDYNTSKEDYFLSSFGPDGKKCVCYLESLSRLFNPPWLRGEILPDGGEPVESFRKIEEIIRGFAPVIEKNIGLKNNCRALSWKYLEFHARMCMLLSKALLEKAEGNERCAKSLWKDTKEYMCSIEDKIQPVFDLFKFVETMDRVLENKSEGQSL